MAPRLSNALSIVMDWVKAKDELADVKPRESLLRLSAIGATFGVLSRGTTWYDLGPGRRLKAEMKPNPKIDQEALLPAIAALKATGPVGKHQAGKLFKWSASLRLGVWNELTDAQRALFEGVVTIEDATPSLELVET